MKKNKYIIFWISFGILCVLFTVWSYTIGKARDNSYSITKGADGQLVILEGTNAVTLDSETDRGLKKRFSNTVLVTGITKTQAFRYLFDWKPITIFLLIIPFGLGIGALIAKLTAFPSRLRKEVISDEV